MVRVVEPVKAVRRENDRPRPALVSRLRRHLEPVMALNFIQNQLVSLLRTVKIWKSDDSLSAVPKLNVALILELKRHVYSAFSYFSP